MFEERIINLIKEHLNLNKEEIEKNLEVPKDKRLGDYAFPCFILSKKLGKSPSELASTLAKGIKKPSYLSKIESSGPYVNFFVDNLTLTRILLKRVIKEKENYGGKKYRRRIVIESPGPNTNKPLHLGHLRNMALGLSLSRINKKLGNKVVHVDTINDRGIHICKSLLAYLKFGKGRKPNKKPDHFVGDFYVRFNQEAKKNPQLEQEALEFLRRWENKDVEVARLAKKLNSWALSGLKKTYKRFGLKVDKTYYESEFYEKGKNIVLEGYKKGLFGKDAKGNLIADLSNENLGEKVLLRQNGTSLYITQDIYLAIERYKKLKPHKMVYIVASEQIYHFKVLFKVLELLGCSFVKNYYHLPYGMVYLPEGKMKSREGAIVDADDLIDQVVNLAKKEILKREKNLSKRELDKRAELIGLGAIKYYLLKYDPLKDITYHPEESISFEGDTGPYIQYSHARIASILRKGRGINTTKLDRLTTNEERNLIKILADYPQVVILASKEYKPSLIATFLFNLAQEFNSFYSKYPVLKSEPELRGARLALIFAIKNILEDGLSLLGISAPERM